MPQSVACPPWEYTDVPGHDAVLLSRATQVLSAIFSAGNLALENLTKDTRRVHRGYFRSLTPVAVEYYAGNYRGAPFHCLQNSQVGIASDPRVGHRPGVVGRSMFELSAEIQDTLSHLDFILRTSDNLMSPAEKLVRCAQLLAAIFVYFLEIHPYLNGNGHMARLILVAGFKRQGFYLTRWPMHPRPPDPPYSNLIAEYRSGNHDGLVNFILTCL